MPPMIGSTLTELGQNILAQRLADDARAQAIAANLLHGADRASRERISNKDIDAANWRWSNPNATQESVNRNNLTMAELPWTRGETPFQTQSRMQAEREALADRTLREKIHTTPSGDTASRNQLLRDYPEMRQPQNQYLDNRLAVMDNQRNYRAQQILDVANNLLRRKILEKKGDLVGDLDSGNRRAWGWGGWIPGLGDYSSNAEKSALAIIANDNNKVGPTYTPTKAYFDTQVMPQIVSDVLSEMGMDGAGLEFDGERGFKLKGQPANGLVTPTPTPQVPAGAPPYSGGPSNIPAGRIGNFNYWVE